MWLVSVAVCEAPVQHQIWSISPNVGVAQRGKVALSVLLTVDSWSPMYKIWQRDRARQSVRTIKVEGTAEPGPGLLSQQYFYYWSDQHSTSQWRESLAVMENWVSLCQQLPPPTPLHLYRLSSLSQATDRSSNVFIIVVKFRQDLVTKCFQSHALDFSVWFGSCCLEI